MASEKDMLAKVETDNAVASLHETTTDSDGLPTLTAEEEKALVRKIDRKYVFPCTDRYCSRSNGLVY